MEETTNNDQIVGELCRLCSDVAVYGIFQHKLLINDFLLLIGEALQCFSSVELNEDDNNSKFLCEACTNELGQAYRFQLKVKCSEYSEATEECQNTQDILGDAEDVGINNVVDGNNFIDDCIENEILDEDVTVKEFDQHHDDPADGEIELLDGFDDAQLIENEQDDEVRIVETPAPSHIFSPREVIISRKASKIPLTGGVASIVNRVPSMPVIVTKKRKISSIDDSKHSPKKSKSIICSRTETTNPKGFDSDVVLITKRDKHSVAGVANRKTIVDNVIEKRAATSAISRVGDTLKLDMMAKFNRGSEDLSVLYQCTYCEKAFSTQYHLTTHNKKTHICQHCLVGFQKIHDLHSHVRAQHSTFPCAVCGKKLSNSSNLRQHLKKLHGIVVPAGSSLVACDIEQLNDDENVIFSEESSNDYLDID